MMRGRRPQWWEWWLHTCALCFTMLVCAPRLTPWQLLCTPSHLSSNFKWLCSFTISHVSNFDYYVIKWFLCCKCHSLYAGTVCVKWSTEHCIAKYYNVTWFRTACIEQNRIHIQYNQHEAGVDAVLPPKVLQEVQEQSTDCGQNLPEITHHLR